MTHIVANYSAHQWFDLDDICEIEEIKLSDIEDYEVKFATLFLFLKDGTVIEVPNEIEIDYEWPTETKIYNDDYDEIDVDQLNEEVNEQQTPDPYDVPMTEEEQARADYENAMLIQSKRDRKEYEALK